MAASTHIFFNAEKSLAAVADELGALLILSFRFIDGEFKKYQAEGGMLVLQLQEEHGFENDKDIPFEHFRYWLSIDCLYRLNIHPYNEHMRQSAARLAYHLILGHLGYPAMLVEDLQQLVEINETPVKPVKPEF